MAKKHTSNNMLFIKPVERSDKGILAYLWRDLVVNGNYDTVMHTLINKYVEDKNRDNKQSSNFKTNKTVTSSSIISLVNSESMTIKTFVMLVTELLKGSELKLYATVKTRDGNTITGEYDFSLLTEVSNELETLKEGEIDNGANAANETIETNSRASRKKPKTRQQK